MRRLLSLILSCVFLFCLIAGTAAAAGEDATIDEPAYTPIYVGDINADPNMLSFTLEDELYVPLETVSEALGSSLYTWNSALQSASLMADDLFLTVSSADEYIIANGRYLYMKNGLQMANGVPMIPMDQLCKAFGVEYTVNDSVVIEPDGTPIQSGEQDYNDEDLYWLSRIIYAEAGGESLEGMIAVGNVVLNRVEAEQFPDNIYDVIFDFDNGIQFSPAYYGSVYNTPSEDAVIAAKMALDGTDVVGDSLYFNMYTITTWASENREFLTQIGCHNFYL